VSTTAPDSTGVRKLGAALVTIAFLGAVIGGVGAPLITPVALDLGVSLDAAQWTLTVTLFAGAISAPVLGRLGTGSHRRAATRIALAFVALGGLLTTLPLPFGILLAGRAFQGLGLGVIALLMSVARDHLPDKRAHSTIATISVASTVGIGVAYPLMGLLDQIAGLQVAYGVGFLLSLCALIIAWRVLPSDPPRPTSRVDIVGAVLLGIGTLGLWVTWERHIAAPLVDLRLFTAPTVLRSNIAMLTAGAGMYLLFSLLTRYVQTPADAGYGFGLSGVLAGAALIPFSVFGFVAGKLTRWLTDRMSARWLFASYAACVAIAAALFAITPGSLVATLAAMAVLGLGVGGASAIMPRLVLDGMPQQETSSILSINQIVRTVGFSIGSALAGMLLASATDGGALFPAQRGYTIAALFVVPLVALSAVAILARSARAMK
jgi:predicted MFS family arabinose efflux permease